MPCIDYNATCAHVVMMLTVSLSIAVAVKSHLYLRQFDVKTAFLHGKISEDIYLKVTEGINIDRNNHLLKLNKSPHALKQSLRNWNKKFDEFIGKFGLIRSLNDQCLYFNNDLTIQGGAQTTN